MSSDEPHRGDRGPGNRLGRSTRPSPVFRPPFPKAAFRFVVVLSFDKVRTTPARRAKIRLELTESIIIVNFGGRIESGKARQRGRFGKGREEGAFQNANSGPFMQAFCWVYA